MDRREFYITGLSYTALSQVIPGTVLFILGSVTLGGFFLIIEDMRFSIYHRAILFMLGVGMIWVGLMVVVKFFFRKRKVISSFIMNDEQFIIRERNKIIPVNRIKKIMMCSPMYLEVNTADEEYTIYFSQDTDMEQLRQLELFFNENFPGLLCIGKKPIGPAMVVIFVLFIFFLLYMAGEINKSNISFSVF